MSERKKVERQLPPKVEPKKRPEPEPELPKVKSKPSDDKYIRILNDAKVEEYRAISERVKNGELKWSHYAVDSDKGYRYYLVIK